jgi:hypothetical protein
MKRATVVRLRLEPGVGFRAPDAGAADSTRLADRTGPADRTSPAAEPSGPAERTGPADNIGDAELRAQVATWLATTRQVFTLRKVYGLLPGTNAHELGLSAQEVEHHLIEAALACAHYFADLHQGTPPGPADRTDPADGTSPAAEPPSAGSEPPSGGPVVDRSPNKPLKE